MKIWTCKIGEVDNVSDGADLPMRLAIKRAYYELTGQYPVFLFSGWAGQLTEIERAEVHEYQKALSFGEKAL